MLICQYLILLGCGISPLMSLMLPQHKAHLCGYYNCLRGAKQSILKRFMEPDINEAVYSTVAKQNVESVSNVSTSATTVSLVNNAATITPKKPKMSNFLSIFNFPKLLAKFESDKEETRRLRRTVFTAADWKKHRSSSRYFSELSNMHRSKVLRGLIKQALMVSLCSSIIVMYNVIVEMCILPWKLPMMTFPSLPFTLTSPSLGLLLVFRTNTAYARWRDARNYWSVISAKTFDVMRQTEAWVEDKAAVARIVRYTVAFSKCLKWHLGPRTSMKRLQDELNGVLLESEIAEIMSVKMKPQYVLLVLTRLISHLNLVPNVQSHIDRGLIELSMAMENCDRIFTTPIPLVYTRLTARFLLLWLITFPMSLYNEFEMAKKFVVPFIIFMNSIFLFGIDDLGVQIEEPFSILPLANICYNIQLSGAMVLQTAGIEWFQSPSNNMGTTSSSSNSNTMNVNNYSRVTLAAVHPTAATSGSTATKS